MQMRFVLPMAAVALALGTADGSLAQDSSPQVRPAQMPEESRCDELLRAVEIEMPNAVGLRVADARRDIDEARELCNSGQSEQGVVILQGVLNSVHEGG